MADSSRFFGLVADNLSDKHMVVVGVGGGSQFAINAARAGVGRLTLIDFDQVERANLPRTAFTTTDIGSFKVTALKEFIARAAPDVRVTAITMRVQDALCDANLAELGHVDIIIAGTDSLDAQAFVNRLALKQKIAAIFVDVHAQARGGMLTLILPGKTPCYRCVAGRRYELQANGQVPVDMPGARGLGADIGFVDSIALKLVLAVLSAGTDTDAGKFFTQMRNRTQVIVRCHPDFMFGDVDIFDLVLSDLPTAPRDYKHELQAQAFMACDTLWLQPEFDHDCPDCAAFGGRL